MDPLGYRDPFGLDGWGNDFADWLDSKIDAVQRYLNLLMFYTNHGIEGYARVFHTVARIFNPTLAVEDELVFEMPGLAAFKIEQEAKPRCTSGGKAEANEF